MPTIESLIIRDVTNYPITLIPTHDPKVTAWYLMESFKLDARDCFVNAAYGMEYLYVSFLGSWYKTEYYNLARFEQYKEYYTSKA